MTLSNDVIVLVTDMFKTYYTGTPTVSFRTSPMQDKNLKGSVVYGRKVSENEVVENVGGSRFRTKAELWLYCASTSKENVRFILDNMKTVHRSHWKAPITGITVIFWRGIIPNDHIDWNPQIFESIIKLEVQWDETV